MGRKYSSELDAHIHHKILTGDAYPAYMEMFRRGARKKLSEENVNVAVTAGKWKGWIGIPIHIMCPDEETAKVMAEALSRFFAEFGFVDVPNQLHSMLDSREWDELPEERDVHDELWPRDGAPLRRR